MNRRSFALALLLCAATAFAQKNTYEMKVVENGWETAWGSQGNGGAEFTGSLLTTLNEPQACIYGPLKIMDGMEILSGGSICARGGHGSLHIADFGTGPFLIDDEGYIFHLPVRPMNPRRAVRDFANGVH